MMPTSICMGGVCRGGVALNRGQEAGLVRTSRSPPLRRGVVVLSLHQGRFVDRTDRVSAWKGSGVRTRSGWRCGWGRRWGWINRSLACREFLSRMGAVE